jgi:hypothetical protein
VSWVTRKLDADAPDRCDRARWASVQLGPHREGLRGPLTFVVDLDRDRAHPICSARRCRALVLARASSVRPRATGDRDEREARTLGIGDGGQARIAQRVDKRMAHLLGHWWHRHPALRLLRAPSAAACNCRQPAQQHQYAAHTAIISALVSDDKRNAARTLRLGRKAPLHGVER